MTTTIASAIAAPTKSAATTPIGITLAPNAARRRAAPVPSLLHQPALIVLGRDDSGKPHASWFDEAEQKRAAGAAAMMGMQALSVATDEIRQLAARLPHGRVFASGRAFVPFVKGALFDELATHLPAGDAVPPVPTVTPARLTGSRTAIKGSAKPELGSSGAKSAGHKAASTKAAAGAATGGSKAGGDAVGGGDAGWLQPTDWSKITVGSLVLASEGHMDGWYESVVEAAQDNDIFLLSWRDWPDEPRFSRHRNQLGLLPSGQLT